MTSSSSIFPDWVLLDRYIFRRDDDSFPADDPTEASCTNSRGDKIRVCFQLHDPPQPSRLYLWWPGGFGECDRFSVVSAHRDAVLLQMAYPIPVPNQEVTYDMNDYFLYRTGGGSPSLIRLPSIDGTMEEFRALFVNGNFRHTNQRLRRIEGLDIAVLSRAEGVAVAELQVFRTPEPELHVIFPSTSASESSKWVVKKPRIIHVPDLNMEHLLFHWYSDTVLPFGSYLCWVDYCQGAVILCNVFDDDPELHYLALPASFSELDHPDGRFPFDMNITVGVNEERGTMKCVRVFLDSGFFYRGSKPPSNLICTSWTLEMTESYKLYWKLDTEVKSVDFWELNGVKTLPHVPLEYPLISLKDPSTVFFVMRLKGARVDGVGYDYDETLLVSFDICGKTVGTSFQYITKEQEGQSDEESMLAMEKFWNFESFIPAEFPKFLKMHGTR